MTPPDIALQLLSSGLEARPLPTLAQAFTSLLLELGVRQAFGVMGGAIAQLFESLSHSELEIIHCRHEGGAAFAALEASFASNLPVALFTTTGPGLTNALTGLQAARWEGGKVVAVSGVTSAAQRGRWAVQETSEFTTPAGLYHRGEVFDFACTLEHPAQLEVVAAQLARGFARPGGFVAHVAMPIAQQACACAPARSPLVRASTPTCSEEEASRLAALLAEKPFVLWVGFGARHAAGEVRRLAEISGCAVMCSPRAKGIFPETHPQFIGVTGLGGHGGVTRHLTEHRPAHVLVLGTRMGEPTSFWEPTLVPDQAFIHVDVDPAAFCAAYPGARTVGIQSDVREFLLAVLRHFPHRAREKARGRAPLMESPLSARADGPVRPKFVVETIQRLVVEGTDAVVLAESGNAFAWANNVLRFDEPHRYRVSVGYGSMGHATAGVLGAALGRGGKAVALVGDGAMLMNSEVNTAVQYGAQAVWVVLNDAGYSMVEHGMRMCGFDPKETEIPVADFALIARGMGAEGINVTREVDLEGAIQEALASERPFVVDVRVDRSEPGPWTKRVRSLMSQSTRSAGGKS
jgi:acetolactate synthase-1/2/3 large subunit